MENNDTTVENGIRVAVLPNSTHPTKATTFYNPAMQVNRELVLCTLGVQCEHVQNDQPVKCLDAFSATGISGLLWAKHFGCKLQVTLNDFSETCVEQIQQNCKHNDIGYSDKATATSDSTEGSQDRVTSTVEVVNCDANILLHQRQFNFVHLDPYGTTVQFLDAALRNIYNNGILVVTSTDLAALYGKCPQVTMRNYGARSIKCDYMKEIAARILLGAVARSAAQCNKAIEVLYSAGVEHFVQVAIRIKRGTSHADESVKQIHRVLHCLLCEEWAIYPNSRSPAEHPYDLLPCECHSASQSSTAVELGPMWCGAIFDKDFICKMGTIATKLSLSDRIQRLLKTLETETECSSDPQAPESPKKEITQHCCQHRGVADKSDNDITEVTLTSDGHDKQISDVSSSATSTEKGNVTDTGDSAKIVIDSKSDTVTSQQNVSSKVEDMEMQNTEKGVTKELPNAPDTEQEVVTPNAKRYSSDLAQPDGKRQKTETPSHGCNQCSLSVKCNRCILPEQTPLFFYTLNKRKISGVDLPKQLKLVRLVREHGYKASRTHFDPKGLRTDATLRQLSDMLKIHCKQRGFNV